MIKNLYKKIIEKSSKPGAEYLLGIIAFCESSFFPIPPDLVLIPMVLSRPKKWIRIGVIATLFSVLGGVFGYFIGIFLWEFIGEPIIHFYKLNEEFLIFQNNYNSKGAIIVFLAGISPIPYKLITIASGGLGLNIYIFILASVFSRGLRFFIIAIIISLFGEKAKIFLEKNLTLTSSMIGIVLIIIALIVFYF